MSRASIISALQSIIANANATTGQSDATVTSATDRLIRGYEGGSSNIVCDVEVTPDGTEYLSFECQEEPDALIIYPVGYDHHNTIVGRIDVVAMKNLFIISEYRGTSGLYAARGEIIYNDTLYPWGYATGNGSIGGTYENGTFTIRARGGEANKWSTSYTYRCIGIKF